jgi:PhnB protein
MTRSIRPRRKPSGRPTGISPIPPGYPPIIPFLAVQGGLAAIEFYKKAFGAHELARETTPDGRVISARLKIGSSMLMLSDVFPGDDTASPSSVGTTTVSLQLYTNDVERAWDRAVAAGAKVVIPLEDAYWGERHGHLLDPFGHHWSLAMRVSMSRAEKAKKQAEAYAVYSHGSHPHQEPTYSDA